MTADEWIASQLAKAGPFTEQQQADLRRLLLSPVDSRQRKDDAA